MKKPILTITGIFCLTLLLGAGCGGDTPPQEQAQETPNAAEPVVRRQPTSDEPINEALDFCEQQGYDVTFVFDQQTKTNRMYCAFEENVGCDILDYYRRRCTPSTAVTIELPNVEHVSFCPSTEEPVCGEDGRNYTNQCIANAQGVRAVHDGPCTEADRAAPQVPDAGNETTDGNDAPRAAGPDGTANTAWLNPLVNLLSKTDGARIEKCSLSGQTLYYQEENCPDCFSTLYNETGDILCFPHNDLADTCPAAFEAGRRPSCEIIWQNN